MNHKKIIGLLLVLSTLGIVVGFILTEPVQFGLCDSEERFGCIRPLGVIGQPLGLYSITLAIIFLTLLFFPKTAFTAWLKFAAWFIPVGAWWVITSPVTCGGPIGMCFDKELATWWSSGIFIGLSLLVIALHYFFRRRSSRLP